MDRGNGWASMCGQCQANAAFIEQQLSPVIVDIMSVVEMKKETKNKKKKRNKKHSKK